MSGFTSDEINSLTNIKNTIENRINVSHLNSCLVTNTNLVKGSINNIVTICDPNEDGILRISNIKQNITQNAVNKCVQDQVAKYIVDNNDNEEEEEEETNNEAQQVFMRNVIIGSVLGFIALCLIIFIAVLGSKQTPPPVQQQSFGRRLR